MSERSWAENGERRDCSMAAAWDSGQGQIGGEVHVEAFEYPEVPGAPSDWSGFAGTLFDTEDDEKPESVVVSADAAAGVDFEKRLAEETHRSFEAGRERGRLEGRQAEREAQAAALKIAEERRTRQAAELLASFSAERDRYLQAVEQEAVSLALAVAARILRREAQMDPLLLTGAVRVALGQLSASTEIRLRVPPAELGLWKEAIALLPNLAVKPTVAAGEGMRLGDCTIETSLGSVDLGIRSQLGEIERGFFDRAAGSHSARSEDAVSAVHQESRA